MSSVSLTEAYRIVSRVLLRYPFVIAVYPDYRENSIVVVVKSREDVEKVYSIVGHSIYGYRIIVKVGSIHAIS